MFAYVLKWIKCVTGTSVFLSGRNNTQKLLWCLSRNVRRCHMYSVRSQNTGTGIMSEAEAHL